MCGGVVLPVAVVPLWQLEQLVSVAAWTWTAPAQLVKPEVALWWQVMQSWPLVGTCPANDAVPIAPFVPSLV
jgi:hypothetical protein